MNEQLAGRRANGHHDGCRNRRWHRVRLNGPLADGWHMSTHAVAVAVAALAYQYARRHTHDPRFAFGTGKPASLPPLR
jgi:hypothetical protein